MFLSNSPDLSPRWYLSPEFAVVFYLVRITLSCNPKSISDDFNPISNRFMYRIHNFEYGVLWYSRLR